MTAQTNEPIDAPDIPVPPDGLIEHLGRGRDQMLNFIEWFGQRFRPQRIPLRRRIMLTFSLGAFALSAFLAAATYGFTKSALIKDRERSSRAQAFRNANQLTDSVINEPANVDLLDRVQRVGDTGAALHSAGNWTERDGLDYPLIPPALQQRVLSDRVAAEMIVATATGPILLIGVPIAGSEASYFESTDLQPIQDTLRNVVGRSIVAAAVVTTGLGLLLGSLAARRSVRPIADAAQAAKAIADGRLDTRLVVTEDPDLHLLATAFNDMASALQLRLERDARFASDVSHELRSPLMTLAASAEVLQARRDEIPERSQAALDLLVADVARFQGMVEDLLEISRFDAGAIRLNKEDLILAEFVRHCIASSSLTNAKLNVSDRAETLIINGDKRRLFRVVANLLDNARFYGGSEGVTVDVSEALGAGEPVAHAWIAVEDHGPGVPAEERTLVFERFARGSSAGRRATSEGAGLGLSLVDEHVRMHGGRVWVEDRLDGEPGARFIVELPAEEVGV